MRLLSLIFAPRHFALLLSALFFVWILVVDGASIRSAAICWRSRW